MVVISFVCLQKINNFPKFGRCGSKIEPATPIWNSKLDWAWQAQFLSHIHEFLQNYLFFKDLQMILVSFFEIFDGFWSTKKLPSLLLHVNQDLLAQGKEKDKLCFQDKWRKTKNMNTSHGSLKQFVWKNDLMFVYIWNWN